MCPDDTTNEIPYGYCHCGCGQKTSIAKRTQTSRGFIKGQPMRYVSGHNGRNLPAQERFWHHVSPGAPEECWLWRGATMRNGYGQMSVGAHTPGAHRVSWEIHFGPIPDGMFVCHRCDTRNCVNPHHLFLGTHSDNMRDMAEKGRATQRPIPLRGEDSPHAKFKNQDILLIREMAAQGIVQRVIAEQFGTSQQVIANIVNRRRWAHVP